MKSYNQTSSQRELDKNVSVLVRGMCITQWKIVSNYCYKQCSNIVDKLLFTLQYNRNISLKNSKKKLRIFPIVNEADISPGKKHHYETEDHK